jgi:hypothetical protein
MHPVRSLSTLFVFLSSTSLCIQSVHSAFAESQNFGEIEADVRGNSHLSVDVPSINSLLTLSLDSVLTLY